MSVVIAVVSGKGGVGKTTTVSNLGIYAARSGRRVAVIDVDPLSDIAELFDLPKSKIESIPDKVDPTLDIESYRLRVFEGLDLLFPRSTKGGKESGELFDFLEKHMQNSLEENYDLILLDMPAGSDERENRDFLKLAEKIVLVTNPDPAAHVAAGSYLSAAADILKELTVYLWHNRYRGVETASFRPNDVIGNYNRNMPEEEQLSAEDFTIRHAAFIPDDSSLDLLQGGVAVRLQLLRNLAVSLDALHEEILASIPLEIDLSPRFKLLLRLFLRNRSKGAESESQLKDFGSYLKNIMGIASQEREIRAEEGNFPESTPLFSPEQKQALKKYFIRCNDNRSRAQLIKARLLVARKLEREEHGASLFAANNGASQDPGGAVDRELSALLMFLEEEVDRIPAITNQSGLILFYFCLYKLLQSDSVKETLDAFVPKRKENGRQVRDRHRQIMRLVQKTQNYRKEYLSLIRKLLPLIMRQVEVMSRTFELKKLIFRKEGKPAKDVYAKLTSNFLHEAINSGLGVVVSFGHRPASRAFEEAAESLMLPEDRQPS